MHRTVYPVSGSEWTKIYARSLGIHIKDTDVFSDITGETESDNFIYNDVMKRLSQMDLSTKTKLLNSLDNEDDPTIISLLKELYLVCYVRPNVESAVDDLGKLIFNMVGISSDHNLLISRPTPLSMIMAGSKISANPDISIESIKGNILLLVQEDKAYDASNPGDPEAQLIAEMLVAYSENLNNNANMVQTMYGIVMVGSYSAFYKMDLTPDVLLSISMGQERSYDSDPLVEVIRYQPGEKSRNYMCESAENIIRTFEYYHKLYSRLKIR
jgi:hypothetical protein